MLPTTGNIEIGDSYVKIRDKAKITEKPIGHAIQSSAFQSPLKENKTSLKHAIMFVAMPAITRTLPVAK